MSARRVHTTTVYLTEEERGMLKAVADDRCIPPGAVLRVLMIEAYRKLPKEDK